MTAQEIHDSLKAKFGEAVLEAKLDAPQPWIKVDPQQLYDAAVFLRETADLAFDYCSCVSGVDYNDGKLGAVYHLFSMVHKHKIVIKAIVPKETPHVRSTAGVWAGANWHEREAFDMVGIVFDGHPDLRRILTPDDYPGHPLRKDFQVPEFYNGMKVPY